MIIVTRGIENREHMQEIVELENFQKFKPFWRMMHDRLAWSSHQYLMKKCILLNRDRVDETVVIVRSEVILDCVLNLVRELYPNSNYKPYILSWGIDGTSSLYTLFSNRSEILLTFFITLHSNFIYNLIIGLIYKMSFLEEKL